MEEPLEIPSAAPKRKGLVIATAAMASVAIIITAVGAVIYFNTQKDKSPLPKEFIETAGHQVYFPQPLTGGYALKPDSVRVDSGSLFYELESAGKTVVVNQQASPKNQKIKIDGLPGFSPLGSSEGQAYSGKVDGKPVVILLAEDTLLNMSTDDAIPASEFNKLAKSLAPVNK